MKKLVEEKLNEVPQVDQGTGERTDVSGNSGFTSSRQWTERR